MNWTTIICTLRQDLNRIGELNFTTTTWFCISQSLKYFWGKKVATKNCKITGSLLRAGLLYQINDTYYIGVICVRNCGCTVARNFGIGYFHEGYHRTAETFMHFNHPRKNRIPAINQVIPKEHRKSFVPYVVGSCQHRITQTARIALADIVHICKFA